MVTAQKSASANFARSLFTRGTDFFGPEEVRSVYMIDLGDTAPAIPFTEEELTRARVLGQYLVLVSDKDSKGKPFTMKSLHNALGNEIGDGKLLCDTSWYKDEPFFAEPIIPTLTWKLVSREVIPGSTSENYLSQTAAIVTYLREQVYDDQQLPTLYQQAVTEFESQQDELARLMNKDWKTAAQRLAVLQINQLFRETPGEVIYRLAMYLKVNHEYLLPNMSPWTKSRSSDGGLVDVGRFDPRGARVADGGPGYSGSSLGVCFSRSSVLES